MVAVLTLDSSVFVAALRKEEPAYESCLKLLENIKNGKYAAIEPYTVLVEIVAAVKRRTGSSELASSIKKHLETLDSIYFVELTKFRADKCAKICEKLSVRGMDAVVIQIAQENNAVLVTLDKEMEEEAKKVMMVSQPNEL